MFAPEGWDGWSERPEKPYRPTARFVPDLAAWLSFRYDVQQVVGHIALLMSVGLPAFVLK